MGVILLLFLSSCQEYEARKTVNKYIDSVSRKAYKETAEYYPNLYLLEEVLILNNLEIVDSRRKDTVIEVICKSTDSGNEIVFEVERMYGKWCISRSKGLSSYIDTPIYQFCKNLNYFVNGDYDDEVTKVCKQEKKDFDFLKVFLKNQLETAGIVLESSSLENFFGYVYGTITIKNNSKVSFPPNSFKLYIIFLDNNGNQVFTLEDDSYGLSLDENEMKSINIGEQFKTNFSFRKVKIKVVVDDSFIEPLVVENQVLKHTPVS